MADMVQYVTMNDYVNSCTVTISQDVLSTAYLYMLACDLIIYLQCHLPFNLFSEHISP